jgi:hypothetical protein
MRAGLLLPDDPQHPVASLEGEVLDVGFAGFAHPQSVQAERHSQGGVGVIEPLGGEEEPAELAPGKSAPLRRMDCATPNVLGGFEQIRPSTWAKRYKPQAVDIRRSIVDAARPRCSVEVRCSSRSGSGSFQHRQAIGGPIGTGCRDRGGKRQQSGRDSEPGTRLRPLRPRRARAARRAYQARRKSRRQVTLVLLCRMVSPGNTRKCKRAW